MESFSSQLPNFISCYITIRQLRYTLSAEDYVIGNDTQRGDVDADLHPLTDTGFPRFLRMEGII